MKLFKKSVSILLSLIMIFSVFTVIPFEFGAAGGVRYIARYWNAAGRYLSSEERACDNYMTFSNDTNVLEDAWYYLDRSMTYGGRLSVRGNVDLILRDGCTLTCNGIYLAPDSQLSVYGQSAGTGTLNANCSTKSYAGIGGNKGGKVGGLVVYGGIVNATGGKYGAGIGGGEDSNNTKPVTIYGGAVKATGGRCSAGIGGGYGGSQEGAVTIYGGTVTATGGKYGAGIGGGETQGGGGSGAEVVIYGGTVNAYGGTDAAGIGGGEDGNGGPCTIYGGTVHAEGNNNGAGIGGGEHEDSGVINVFNSNVTAIGGNNGGAGIGGGGSGGTNRAITIRNSVVVAKTATWGNDTGGLGAGIGGGSGRSQSGSIRIYDSDVYAQSGVGSLGDDYGGAAIGGGNKGNGGYIYIENSNVVAIALTGAGIGGGDGGYGIFAEYGHNGTVEIVSSKVYAVSRLRGAGIGGGDNGDGGTVKITDSEVTAIGGGSSYIPDIVLPDVDATFGEALGALGAAFVLTSSCRGAGIGGGDWGDGGKVTITNSKVTAIAKKGSGAKAIGRGDDGDKDGSLSISDYEKVSLITAEKNDGEYNIRIDSTVPSADRISACRNNTAVQIERCDHPDRTYTYVSHDYHQINCSYCKITGLKYSHEFDEEGTTCPVCGYQRLKVSFLPGEGSGRMDDTYVDINASYTLPWSGFTPPEGKVFYGWDAVTDGHTTEDLPVGTPFTLTHNLTLTARYTDAYHLWVFGTQVTEYIKDDILGDGKVSYDPDTCTLHFDDFSDPLTGRYAATMVYSEGINLTITGKAKLSGSGNGIRVQSGSLTVDGDLTVNSENMTGIFSDKNIILNSGTITASGGLYGIRTSGTVFIREGVARVTADASSLNALYYSGLDMDPTFMVTEVSPNGASVRRARHVVIEPGAVKVTFVLNGGRIDYSQNDIETVIMSGSTVERPADPTKGTGHNVYGFGGWCTDETYTTEFDFSQPITENTVIYARWTRTLSARIVWSNSSESRPDEVTVALQRLAGDTWSTVRTAVAREDNGWRATFDSATYIDTDDAALYRFCEINSNGEAVPIRNYTDEPARVVLNVDGEEKGYLVGSRGSLFETDLLNNGAVTYSAKKEWDSALSEQERPAEVEAVLQRRRNELSWESLQIVTLNAADNWEAAFTPVDKAYGVDGEYTEYQYRVRELKPAQEDASATQTDEERLASAGERVIYDEKDHDNPFVLDIIKEVYGHVPEDDAEIAALDWDRISDAAEGRDVPTPEVEFTIEGYTDSAAHTDVDQHTLRFKVSYTGGFTTVITNTTADNRLNLEKKWEIDIEDRDRPDSVQMLIQEKDADSWKSTDIVTISEDEGWTKSVAVPRYRIKDGKPEETEYRVRELKEESLYNEFMSGLRDLVMQGRETYDEWMNRLRTEGEAIFSQLPEDVRTAAEEGYDALLEAVQAQPSTLYDKLLGILERETVDSRIVHDKDDSDKGDGKTNCVTYNVDQYISVVSGGTEDDHTTVYQVDYSSDNNDYTVTNKAIQTVDLYKHWIHIAEDDGEKPDSAYLVLMCKPKAGALDNAADLASAAGIDLSGVLNYEFPVLDPLEGGTGPFELLSELALGIDLSFFDELTDIPKVAIAKVDEDSKWKTTIVDSKYVSGIPKEYKAAELSSEIIRQLIKYLTDGTVDLPISYNPFDNYISVPTKAIPKLRWLSLGDLDLSSVIAAGKNVSASDLEHLKPADLVFDRDVLMANVINVQISIKDHDHGTDTVGKLKIIAGRPSSDAAKEQAFVYRLTGSDIDLTAAIILEAGETEGDVTIAQLPSGDYTVTEEHGWSWRYSDGGRKSATVGTDTARLTFDHSLDHNEWLSGCSHKTDH